MALRRLHIVSAWNLNVWLFVKEIVFDMSDIVFVLFSSLLCGRVLVFLSLQKREFTMTYENVNGLNIYKEWLYISERFFV